VEATPQGCLGAACFTSDGQLTITTRCGGVFDGIAVLTMKRWPSAVTPPARLATVRLDRVLLEAVPDNAIDGGAELHGSTETPSNIAECS
jgi:hypothetical protein